MTVLLSILPCKKNFCTCCHFACATILQKLRSPPATKAVSFDNMNFIFQAARRVTFFVSWKPSTFVGEQVVNNSGSFGELFFLCSIFPSLFTKQHFGAEYQLSNTLRYNILRRETFSLLRHDAKGPMLSFRPVFGENL